VILSGEKINARAHHAEIAQRITLTTRMENCCHMLDKQAQTGGTKWKGKF